MKKNSNTEIEVETAKVQKRNITKIVSSVGKIQPETEVKVFSETSGELINLNAKEGDFVSSGFILAKIQPDIVQSQMENANAVVEASKNEIEVAKAGLEKAQIDIDRAKKLFEKKYIPENDVIVAQTTFNQAKANLDAAKSRLNQSIASAKQIRFSAVRTTVYAPMNGTVTKLSVKKGEKVLGQAQFQGTELMRVSDLNVMNAEVDVDESEIINVKLGDTAKIEVDALPDQVFKGIVIEIGNAAKTAEVATQDQVINFKVKVRIIDPSKKFRPGMSCNVDIVTETKYNVVTVPLISVTSKKDTTQKIASPSDVDNGNIDAEAKKNQKVKPTSYVYIKQKDNTVKLRKVVVGINSQDFIEIKSGLNEGEEIVSGPYSAVNKELKDGAKIKLANAKEEKKSK
jgi:HlyD family secretion protein